MQQRPSGGSRPRLFKRAAIFSACGVGTIVACYGPTELTLAFSTDASCAVVQANGIAISVSESSATLGATPPVATSFTCEQGPDPNLGTLVLTPSAGSEQVVVQVVLGVDRSTTDCQPPAKVEGCIVARRRVTYQRHRSLRVPIRLDLACKGKTCAPDETCSRGDCVLAEISVCESGDCVLPTPSTEAGGPLDPGPGPGPGPGGEGGASIDATIDAPIDAPPSLLDASFCALRPVLPECVCQPGDECCVTLTGIRCVTAGICVEQGVPATKACTHACQCAQNEVCGFGPDFCPVRVCGADCKALQ